MEDRQGLFTHRVLSFPEMPNLLYAVKPLSKDKTHSDNQTITLLLWNLKVIVLTCTHHWTQSLADSSPHPKC
jgi:hypothetical protein